MWTIVFLAMGGIALGKGVMSSGLLQVMDTLIRDLMQGFELYTVVLILSPIVLVSRLNAFILFITQQWGARSFQLSLVTR